MPNSNRSHCRRFFVWNFLRIYHFLAMTTFLFEICEGFLRAGLSGHGHPRPFWKIAKRALFNPCMNLIIRVNLLVVFLLDALLDVPEWGFDPDSFCCLEWSWVLRVLWDMVLYPWCGLVGFFPTSNRWFIFAVPENNIGLQVISLQFSKQSWVIHKRCQHVFPIFWHPPFPLSAVSYFCLSAKCNPPPTKLPTSFIDDP